ncbi:MAG: HAD hydrolase family protein, partial [Kiritimatiellae bacterium]|nr:HAD hydrolase family protein [Kiritimatiellia bacterium]
MDDIRIIALDLDGTLLDSDKNLSETNREALAAAAAK